MFKRRFISYIIGGGIVTFLSVSYVGYRAYRNHVEFKGFMSNTQIFNRSVKGQQEHSSHDHTYHGEGLPVASTPNQMKEAGWGETGHGPEHHLISSGEYGYEINGVPLYSNMPLNQEQLELREWIQTGKMTPAVGEQFASREELRTYVQQTVVTADGKLHTVIVPRDSQYEEGDAILQSELGSPMVLTETQNPKRDARLIIDKVEYTFPDEYYTIEDPYEREEYANKFSWSIKNGVSMGEVEKKIVQGELDFSLSEDAKKYVDEHEAMMERYKMLDPIAPSLSDKPPVKVSFLPDKGENTLPGWMRKEAGDRPSGSGETESGGAPPAADSVSEKGSNEDVSGAPIRSDVPLSPSDQPDMLKPIFPQSVVDIEKQLTPEGIESELSEGLSPDRFDKMQQFIDQYGREEGLRRLRETDPEAAAQFERDQRERKMNTEP